MKQTRAAYVKVYAMFHKEFLQMGFRKGYYQHAKETKEEISKTSDLRLTFLHLFFLISFHFHLLAIKC